MKALKIIGIILAVLVALVFVVPLFLPATTTVEKTVIIERPLEIIFDDLTNFEVYKQWNPWSQMEPEAEGTITGEPGTVGHKWEWKGDKIGKGSLTIKEIQTYESIVNDLVFIEPWQSKAEDIWLFERTDEGFTKITWRFETKASYPFGRLMGIMVKMNLGKQYEEGINNLKELIENKY